MRARSLLPALALLGVLLAGTLPAAPGAVVTFQPPVKLNDYGYGYEPSIDVDAQGTLYATAHKSSLLLEGQRLSSFLWYSHDEGATWSELPSPAGAHEKLFAFEGDLAVDALDRLYYVDTYAADNSISRWSQGPEWDYSLPAQRTTGVDDRPWLAAHGDGIVYYLGNNGVSLVSPGDLANGALPGQAASRIFFYRSTDGGITWSAGHAFPGASWCGIAASPADDHTVAVVCSTNTGFGFKQVIHESADRGATWTSTPVYAYKGGESNFPSIAFDAQGRLFAALVDVLPGAGDRLIVARSIGRGGWITEDVTPLAGMETRRVWISAARDGDVAIAYYATPSPATRESLWHAYATVSGNAGELKATWATATVDPTPVTKGTGAPADFMQVVVGPDGVANVAYGRDAVGDLAHAADYTQDILVARQATGPNVE